MAPVPDTLSRRTLLRSVIAAPLAPLARADQTAAPAVRASRPRDIRIVEVGFAFEDIATAPRTSSADARSIA